LTGRAPQVFTIPAGIPFARALAAGVVSRAGSDPLALANALVFVPTRRAARVLREAFAQALGGAALLPRIRALGDADDEETLFDPLADDLRLIPAIAPLRRRLLLATLVQRWGERTGAALPFTQALTHAGELAHFLDEAVTQGADLSKLETLARADLAQHWNIVVDFLRIIAEQWPKLLAAEGAAEPARHRDTQLRALSERLKAQAPRAPVIAAGSTGSIPATAELLKTIAHLPAGAVVLPSLDRDLDESSWEALDAAHAQFGLRQLLAHLDVGRGDVAAWTPLPEAFAGRASRVRFLSEALRPPPTTDAWRDLVDRSAPEFASGLENFSLIEAANPREEALIVACALREVLETPHRTAALVTPDRGLARRVAAELNRWDIVIDDSAGKALARTPPGAFLALIAQAVADDFAPVSLLALLKHPLAAGGQVAAEFRRRARELELAALRGLRPEPGFAGIAARLRGGKAKPELQSWFARLARMLEPLTDAMAAKAPALNDLARAHGAVAEALAATDRWPGASLLWRGEAGESAANLLNELQRDGEGIALDDPRRYAELFRDLAEMRAVRPPYNLHPRLAILGPLEARLLDFDLVILSALNEGRWPAEAATDPWLSRPMRAKLGLEPPERRIGLAAHDFATLAASRTVLMTRSLKENGAPTVASRWLLRIKQLAKGLGLDGALDARNDLRDWARALDQGPRDRRAPRPAPRPPVSSRPRTLSVTEIETWLRDPYAIYAKHVLKLRPLDPIDLEPSARERGIAVHRALERFLGAYPGPLPADALAQLLALGDEAFARAGASTAVLALWRPRFERAARWFLAHEAECRQRIVRAAVEMTGKLEIPAPAPFTLRGRADRIDFFDDESVAIIDYKTGRAPTHKQINALVTPQLPLEAAMLLGGGFTDCRAASVRALVHIRLTGGDPAGEELRAQVTDANALAMKALARLVARVARYDDPAQPYRSREMPFLLGEVGDYDHLARVREWSRAGESEEEE
jgi:ATP-dependent helicase/nuclease subunit B